MKTTILTIITLLFATSCMAQNISGVVTDGKEALAGVNVWIDGTIAGCLTDSVGRFSFEAPQRDTLTLCISCIGYEPVRRTLSKTATTDLVIKMREQLQALKEVVVTGSSFRFGNTGETRSMSALDVVMEGNSCGDIVAALQTLPGTQKVGEDGKLYVRGGSSEECQTFINGMHVLQPYTASASNDAVRGRFSPFLFKGMNFSLGGYSAEYGQALSAVLPMETTDRQTSDKLGVSASLLDWNVGGTKAFKKSSLSFNAAYTNLRPYHHLFPSDIDWTHPYEDFSGEMQFKTDISSQWTSKTYLGYDFTHIGIDRNPQMLNYREQNLYANSTLRGTLSHDWTLFFGIAGSAVFDRINDALINDDHLSRDHYEIHIKAMAKKYFGSSWRLMAGMEDYIRKNQLLYATTTDARYNLHYQIPALFADAQTRLVRSLYLRFSSRLELDTYNHQWEFMPRATLSYVPSRNFQTSLIAGRYSQTTDDDYIAQSYDTNFKEQSTADHAIVSVQYSAKNTSIRLEGYYKKYHNLPLLRTADEVNRYTSNGYGTSKGFDFFVENHWFADRVFTRMSYSYNDSKRLYLDYPKEMMPTFASRHNFRLSTRFFLLKSLSMSVADSYASRRQSEGRKTPVYNSLDLSLTWLAHKKVIVYTSCSNILGRRNVYGYQNGQPIVNSSRRSFYIGVFISLKSNKAYDISNF